MLKMKKIIFTLNIDNYEPKITELTYPLIQRYADKIGADFYVIKERKFPDMPVTYEKFQIYDLAIEMKADWVIFFDSDVLVHPDLFDVTTIVSPDTVLYNDKDFATCRWSSDRFFRRDGRHIGTCSWFSVCPIDCIDLWRPVDDLSLEEILNNIHLLNSEKVFGMDPEHLIDDYITSRNIAKYGLKHQTVMAYLKSIGRENERYYWHEYCISLEKKVELIKSVLSSWNIV